MFIDYNHLTAESELRRAALLADAENYRLARLARRARSVRVEPSRGDPPARATADNDEAERRYAVSR
ncbi:hypothetical protein [Pseudonocardia zijingensis]|jgi:hypothetical protein|uniref:Uncharacterized protein n=1 Tax=Pseudonocardia zijingensis TaxID=153376 RepID=A0ABN1PY69_9PSEU